jgi:hypothetical protein
MVVTAPVFTAPGAAEGATRMCRAFVFAARDCQVAASGPEV